MLKLVGATQCTFVNEVPLRHIRLPVAARTSKLRSVLYSKGAEMAPIRVGGRYPGQLAPHAIRAVRGRRPVASCPSREFIVRLGCGLGADAVPKPSSWADVDDVQGGGGFCRVFHFTKKEEKKTPVLASLARPATVTRPRRVSETPAEDRCSVSAA